MNDPLVIGAVVAAAIAALWAFWPIKPPAPPAAPAPQFYPSPAPALPQLTPGEIVYGVLNAQASKAKGDAVIDQYTAQEVRSFGRGMAEAYGNPAPLPTWYSGTGTPTPPPGPPN